MSDWISEFRQFFSTVFINPVQIEAAMNLKLKHIPKRLYKFRKFNRHTIDALASGTTWVSHASNMNDPYECFMRVDYERIYKRISFEDVKGYLPSEALAMLDGSDLLKIQASSSPMDDAMDILLGKDTSLSRDQKELSKDVASDYRKKMNRERNEFFWNSLQQGFQISSFSERNDSSVMWSHYASNHTGVCFEYNLEPWSDSEIRKRLLFPVVYTDMIFDATDYIRAPEDSLHLNNVFAQIAASTKSKDWEYEKEWRLVFPIGHDNPDWAFNIGFPSKVLLGSKIKPRNEKAIRNICLNNKIEVKKMTVSSNEFRMIEE